MFWVLCTGISSDFVLIVEGKDDSSLKDDSSVELSEVQVNKSNFVDTSKEGEDWNVVSVMFSK